MGYRDNNKYNKSNNVIIDQTIPREIFLFKIDLSRDINNDSFTYSSNVLLSFKSIEKSSKLAS